MKWIKRLSPVAILIVGIVVMKGVAALGDSEAQPESIDTRPSVQVTNLQPTSYSVTIEGFGELAPLESTSLSAQVSGEVTYWHPQFIAGGQVKSGTVLFSIEKDTYEAALLQAQANLAAAEAALIEEEALAEVAKQEAANLPKSRFTVTDLYLRKPQILSAQAAVKAAQAQLKIAKRDLANCDVTAPYDALIVSRNIGKGDFVNTGTMVAQLFNIETAEVTFPVARFDQIFLPQNLTQIAAELTQVNRSDDAITRIGMLNRETGLVDADTRMTHLVARIDDPYGLKTDAPVLRFGSYVKVTFTGRTLENVYKLPQELITRRQLWILDDEDRLQSVPVEVLREEGSFFYFHADIDASARIVMTLPEYPQNGMAVKVVDGTSGLVASQQ
ncbi:efflux RND transporter periplasmic adaptor subunit [Alteromonas lipolytica]|uniref:Efflux transporter periplasmic adaptor subunit n=1 Tax=Alteromonas lipolytica TaxID=1856405 RepID=A0A1E8FFZ4_9ALTE|nr:efflux RND transporter periplasmic adaptor subunit [Alteromonas lipolytica]OFI34393.1 efflux transporter periplasmic adaptor subunit [Alteromonas lipolytica]